MSNEMKRAREITVRFVCSPSPSPSAVTLTCDELQACSALLGGMAEDLDSETLDVEVHDEREAAVLANLMKNRYAWDETQVASHILGDKGCSSSWLSLHVVNIYHTLDKYNMQWAMETINQQLLTELNRTLSDKVMHAATKAFKDYREHPQIASVLRHLLVVENGRVEEVELLMNDESFVMRTYDGTDHPVHAMLELATVLERTDICKIILESKRFQEGFREDQRCNEFSPFQSLLDLAVVQGDLEMCRLLLNLVDLSEHYDGSLAWAIKCAVRKRNAEMCELLLSYCEVLYYPIYSDVAESLAIAVENRDVEMCKLLMEAVGNEWDRCYREFQTAFSIAKDARDIEMCHILINEYTINLL
jgi:hypothetical protein